MSEDEDLREPDQLEGVKLPEFRNRAVGHDGARAAILDQLATGRLPGGILLHGPRGVGKATLAFDIARKVFEATSDETPAHIAAQVASGGYPNLYVLRRIYNKSGTNFATVITINQISRREKSDPDPLLEKLHLTRGRRGKRVCIVDAIDDCNASTTNALLKILEEPPPDTHFILISHRPGGLLPTIRSRCQPVALRPLADADVRTILEADGIGPAGIDAAVALAVGRPRRAYEALALGDNATLTALQTWLRAPGAGPGAAAVKLAETLATDKAGAAYAFGRQMMLDWIAAETRDAAQSGPASVRLASAGALWDKATALFADADTYNLDARQALVTILDAIRRHAQAHLLVAGTL